MREARSVQKTANTVFGGERLSFFFGLFKMWYKPGVELGLWVHLEEVGERGEDETFGTGEFWSLGVHTVAYVEMYDGRIANVLSHGEGPS